MNSKRTQAQDLLVHYFEQALGKSLDEPQEVAGIVDLIIAATVAELTDAIARQGRQIDNIAVKLHKLSTNDKRGSL